MINSVIVCGNLTRDPEIRETANSHVMSFGIAVNEKRRNAKTGVWEDVPNYFECQMWGDRTEALVKFLKKGMKVTVSGSLKYEAWEKDGQKRSAVRINVRDVELPSRAEAQGAQPCPQAPQDGYYPTPF